MQLGSREEEARGQGGGLHREERCLSTASRRTETPRTSFRILSMILPALPSFTACGLITQQVQLSNVAVAPPPFLAEAKSMPDKTDQVLFHVANPHTRGVRGERVHVDKSRQKKEQASA